MKSTPIIVSQFISKLVTKPMTVVLAFCALLLGTLTSQAQPTGPATAPSLPQGQVISMFNSAGAYYDSPGITWHASWSGDGGLTDYNIPPTVKKYSAVQYSGVEFYGNPINASGCETFHVSVWTTSDQFGLKVVSLTAGSQDPQINFPPGSLPAADSNGWYNLEIPISWLVASNATFDASNIQQLLWLDNSGVGPGTTGQDIYIDNVYFSSSTNLVHAPVTRNVSASAATMVNPFLYDISFGAQAVGAGLGDLNASYLGSTLTFAPSTYGSIVGDNYVAVLYDTDPTLPGSLYAPSKVVFSGNCLSSTLDPSYTVVAFIKDFASDYSSFVSQTVPLTNGQPFSVELTTSGDSTRHIQWGFEMTGVAVADNSALGNVQIAVAAAAQQVSLTSQPHGYGAGWFSDNFGNGNYWFGNNEWAIPVNKISANSNGVSGAVSVNMNPYYDNANNSGVYDQGTGDPIVTNNVTYYVQDNSLNGAQVIFSGYCWSNTLTAEYTATAYILELDGSYGLLAQTSVPLVTGQPFQVSHFATNGAAHIYYGLRLVGIAERRLPVDEVGTHGTLTVGSTPTPLNLTVDTGAIVYAYANIFNDAARTSYAFGFDAAAGDLPATVNSGVITLAPNTAYYNGADSAWSTDGVPNKYVEANFYAQDGGYQSAGTNLPTHPLTFSGYCWSNTTSGDVSEVAFIQVFDPVFNRLSIVTAPLVAGEKFTLNITPPAGTVVQYGFQVLGLDYSPTNTDLGTILVSDHPNILLAGGSGVVKVNSNYNATVSATGGTAPYSYSATLPAGLSLNSASGEITGSIAAVGVYSFVVTATDAEGMTGSKTVLIRVTPTKTDTAIPTVAITSPLNNGVVTNAPLTVTGTASDAGVVYAVHYWLDDLNTNNPATGIATGTTNWSIVLAGAAAGQHTVMVRSEDVSGNLSKPVSRLLHYGTNSFTALAGEYNGLFSPGGGTTNFTHADSGYFQVKVKVAPGKLPTFSVKLQVDGNTVSGSGKFEMTGVGTLSALIDRTTKYAKTNLTLTLTLPFDDSGTITGEVHPVDNAWSSTMLGYQYASNNVSSGNYTLVVPGDAPSYETEPGGSGYGVVTITNNIVKVTGALGDGEKLEQKVGLSAGGMWPFYSTADKMTGALGKPETRSAIMGWVVVTNDVAAPLAGTLKWDKQAYTPDVGKTPRYTNGFAVESVLASSGYFASDPNLTVTPVLTTTTNLITFEATGSNPELTNSVTLNLSSLKNVFVFNKLTNTNKMSLAVAAKTGKLTLGMQVNPLDSLTVAKGQGVILTNINAGVGFFLPAASQESGAVTVQAAP